MAAVVVAAEAWATDGDDLEGRLRAEIDAGREAAKRAEDAEYQARRDAHRAEYGDPARYASAGSHRAGPNRPLAWEAYRQAYLTNPEALICDTCATPVSLRSCSCGATRAEDAA